MQLNLISKEDAGYRVGTDGESCKDCMSFKAPDMCDKVENPVDAAMTCDEFDPGMEEAPAPMMPQMPV